MSIVAPAAAGVSKGEWRTTTEADEVRHARSYCNQNTENGRKK